MHYDDLYEHIGHIGLYQWFIFGLDFIFTMYTVDSIHMNFIGGAMDHWCRVDELVDQPYDVQKHVAIPATTTTGDKGGNVTTYSSCEMFAYNYSWYNDSDFVSWDRKQMITNTTQIVDCERWTYDQSTFESTIVSKFNLVCGLELLNQLASTLFMVGTMFGALSSGAMSDRFGRKKTMVSFCCVKLCGNLLSIFAPNYPAFAAARFIIGFGQVGYYLPGFTLVMETVGPKYRSGLGCVIQIGFSVGFMLQPAIGYALRDEFTYQLAAVGPNFVFPLVMIFCVPESLRWLIVRGKFDEASASLRRICKINRRPFPVDLDLRDIDESPKVANKGCALLLSSRVLRLRAILLYFSWITCSLIYYALSLNTGSLSGDIYLNTFISAAVEVPAYIAGWLLMDWRPFGRRFTGLTALVGAGVSSLVSIPLILLGYDLEATVISMIGKAFITMGYGVVYVFGSELFPTELRSAGMGLGSMLARVGSMFSSFVGKPLADVWAPLPSLLFGVLATAAGLSYLLLPETLNQPLADTVDQAEGRNRKSSRSNERPYVVAVDEKLEQDRKTSTDSSSSSPSNNIDDDKQPSEDKSSENTSSSSSSAQNTVVDSTTTTTTTENGLNVGIRRASCCGNDDSNSMTVRL